MPMISDIDEDIGRKKPVRGLGRGAIRTNQETGEQVIIQRPMTIIVPITDEKGNEIGEAQAMVSAQSTPEQIAQARAGQIPEGVQVTITAVNPDTGKTTTTTQSSDAPIVIANPATQEAVQVVPSTLQSPEMVAPVESAPTVFLNKETGTYQTPEGKEASVILTQTKPGVTIVTPVPEPVVAPMTPEPQPKVGYDVPQYVAVETKPGVTIVTPVKEGGDASSRGPTGRKPYDFWAELAKWWDDNVGKVFNQPVVQQKAPTFAPNVKGLPSVQRDLENRSRGLQSLDDL